MIEQPFRCCLFRRVDVQLHGSHIIYDAVIYFPELVNL